MNGHVRRRRWHCSTRNWTRKSSRSERDSGRRRRRNAVRASTRALLIHLDYQGLIKLHWSPLLLSEMSDALVRTGRKKTLADARKHEALMNDALPNAMVPTADVQQQFHHVQPAVKSAKDMHVAACAYALIDGQFYGNDPVVLTSTNEGDFDPTALGRMGIFFRQPDTFLLGLYQLDPHRFAEAFRSLRLSLSSQPTVEALLDKLRADGQVRTVVQMLAAHQAGALAF